MTIATIATDSIERFTEELKILVDQLRRSTVQVRGHRNGIGSGVIWNADGVIVTNAHVIQGDLIEIELFDKRILQATVITKSLQRDLAALKVNATDLPGAPIGDSDQVRVGELAIAVGNPLGMVGAVTTGIVHNLGPTNFSRRHWIQADVQLAPGNSGGPLANAQGQVIGINTMIVDGKGFAVPSNIVQRFLQEKDQRPYLGVALQLVRVPRLGRRAFGLLITSVETGSPAEMAQLLVGDILIGVRSKLFRYPNELFYILENSNVGDGLSLDILRGSGAGADSSVRQLVADVVLCSKDLEARAA